MNNDRGRDVDMLDADDPLEPKLLCRSVCSMSGIDKRGPAVAAMLPN